jgi:hypothetical protein
MEEAHRAAFSSYRISEKVRAFLVKVSFAFAADVKHGELMNHQEASANSRVLGMNSIFLKELHSNVVDGMSKWILHWNVSISI